MQNKKHFDEEFKNIHYDKIQDYYTTENIAVNVTSVLIFSEHFKILAILFWKLWFMIKNWFNKKLNNRKI